MVSAKKERPKTRELIRWDEDKDIQILLGLVSICNRSGIKLPWDEVAQAIGPSVTGNAVVQHLAKLRKKRLQESEDGNTPGGFKNSKRGSFSSKVMKGVVGSQDDQDDIDPDQGDPDESYGEQSAKKRKSRGNQKVNDTRGGYDNIVDVNDDDNSKALVNTPSKRRKSGASYKDRKIKGIKNEVDFEVEPGLPSKKAVRRTSNAFSESVTDDSDDGEEYVATGAQFLGFEKRRPDTKKSLPKQRAETPSDRQTKQTVNMWEDIDNEGAPKKIVSLRFNDKEALKRFPSSSAASDIGELREDNAVRYTLAPYVSSSHNMYGMDAGMSMPQRGVAGGLYLHNAQYGMYDNPFAPDVSHGLTSVAHDSRGFYPTYQNLAPQMRYAPATVHNEMYMGSMHSDYQQQYRPYQDLEVMDPMGVQRSSFAQHISNSAPQILASETTSNVDTGGMAAVAQNEENLVLAYDDDGEMDNDDEPEDHEAGFSDFVHDL